MLQMQKPKMTDHVQNFTESLLDNLSSGEDGYFQIDNRDGDAFLTVHASGKKGKQVSFDDVWARVLLFEIQGAKESEIRPLVDKPDSRPHSIGKWLGKPEDSEIHLEISDDKMQAFATLTPPKYAGKTKGKEEVLHKAETMGIRFGWIEENLEKFASDPPFHRKIQIAAGKEAIPGGHGHIQIVFEENGTPHFQEDEFGRVDFKSLQKVKSVEKGQVLAEKISPSPGENGCNIMGEILPFPEGEEANWNIGANVELSSNGKQAIASITGRPIADRQGCIRVDEICYLESVDFSTGNVTFPGTIIVEERVADGFKLETEGSIFIKKSLGRVYLKAGGDIVLSGGFMGRGGGVVEAGGDIYARFVEQGRVIAKGSIFIEEASMHSDLTADESIVVRGGRGEIIGGEIAAGKSIVCTKLGAVVETKTRASVGIPPELMKELQKMQSDLQRAEEVLFKAEKSLTSLKDNEQRRELNPKEEEMKSKLLELQRKYLAMRDSLQSQYQTAVTSFEPVSDALVEVEKEIYPGVEIYFGKNKSLKARLKEIPGPSFVTLGIDGGIQTSKVRPKIQTEKDDSSDS